jgi:hypothetical protein
MTRKTKTGKGERSWRPWSEAEARTPASPGHGAPRSPRPLTARSTTGANVLLPARSGNVSLRVPVPRGIARVKVVLLEGGVARGDERTFDLE